MTRLLLITSLGLALSGCGASRVDVPVQREQCLAAASCGECLKVSGCNWSAGSTCDVQCLADSSCVGPANPAAPSCP